MARRVSAGKRLMVIGAHADDCELVAGGLAALCSRRGWTVRFLTATSSNAGHQEMGRRALAARRAQEARAAAHVLGATAANLGEDDGGLYVTPRTSDKMIAAIRRFDPDVVVTHRTCDYHRDHRVTAQLVLDASYMLMVPLVCPAVPAMKRMPVIMYHYDHFTEGPQFRPHVVIDIGPVLALRMRALLKHASQILEWLPWVGGNKSVSRRHPLADTPALRAAYDRRAADIARRFAPALRRKYRRAVRYAEAFQVSEYARRPSRAELSRLLPW